MNCHDSTYRTQAMTDDEGDWWDGRNERPMPTGFDGLFGDLPKPVWIEIRYEVLHECWEIHGYERHSQVWVGNRVAPAWMGQLIWDVLQADIEEQADKEIAELEEYAHDTKPVRRRL